MTYKVAGEAPGIQKDLWQYPTAGRKAVWVGAAAPAAGAAGAAGAGAAAAAAAAEAGRACFPVLGLAGAASLVNKNPGR